MNTAVFRVKVYCASNGLCGMVDVVSLTSSSAKRFALKTFFRGKGWEVTDCLKLRNLGA